MEGHLLMSHKDLERKRVLDEVRAKRLTLRKASQLLAISYRQTVRIWNRYKKEAAKGLTHRSRGRPSNRRYPAAFRNKVIKRYGTRTDTRIPKRVRPWWPRSWQNKTWSWTMRRCGGGF